MDNQSTTNQPTGQPVMGEVPAPLMTQSTPQPIPQPVINPPIKLSNPKKKIFIVGGIVGIAVIALIVVLLVVFLNHGAKIVSCTTHSTTMGTNIDAETNFKVEDGKIVGGDQTVNFDLKTLNEEYAAFASSEKETVDEMNERYRSRYCEEHCTFLSDYVEGDHLKITMKFDEEGVDNFIYAYGTEDMSAQEIADEIQESMERDEDTTCKQN